MNLIALITALYAAAGTQSEDGSQTRVLVDDRYWGLIDIREIELTVDKEGHTIIVIHTERS